MTRPALLLLRDS